MTLDTMPDGTDFISWEQPAVFSRTLHVNNRHRRADDANPGTADAPFASINAAARMVQPGERVLVHPGVYREWDTHSAVTAVTVTFDPAMLTCDCTVNDPLPTCPPLPEAELDYHGRPRMENTVLPGPFAKRPRKDD